MAEHSPDGAGKKIPKRRARILVGAAVCLAVLLFGATLMRLFLTPKETPQTSAPTETAVLDLKEIVAAHPSYEKLQTLIGERETMQEELRMLLDVPLTVQPATVDAQPFDDSVWQKNAQDVIGNRAALERKQKKAAQEREEATRPEFEAARDAINEEYWNEILNIKLKLDNREAMGLTQATIDQLTERLRDLEDERGARQIALYRSWQNEIQSYAAASIADDLAAGRAEMERLKAQREQEAAGGKAFAQARDIEQIQAKMQESIERQQKAQATQEELAAKESEITTLENRILRDIASRAAKIAILHHYTLIVSDPARSLASLLPDAFRRATDEKYVKTIAVRADDVTEEVKNDLAANPPETEDAPE